MPSLRRLSQLPVSLPDALSTARRLLSFHQFPTWIAPCPRPERGLLAVASPPDGFVLRHHPSGSGIDIAVTLSPFGPVQALLPFPFQGRFQLQYSPPPGSLTRHCCLTNHLHRILVEDVVQPALHSQLLWISIVKVAEVTLRLPVFPI